jgi:hypothetical protein
MSRLRRIAGGRIKTSQTPAGADEVVTTLATAVLLIGRLVAPQVEQMTHDANDPA